MASLYVDAYVPVYRSLYIDHPQWTAKNALNVRLLGELLEEDSRWLDTCCGQGWQLAQFPDVATRVGVDASAAQLAAARDAAPGVEFHHSDVLEWQPPGDFDLCTNFWGSLSYLGSLDRIAELLDRLSRWTAAGGSIYLELITPELLAQFNETPFARENQCRVDVSDEPWAWSYRDPAGVHRLASPPVDFFLERLQPYFRTVEPVATVTAMTQLIARGRLG